MDSQPPIEHGAAADAASGPDEPRHPVTVAIVDGPGLPEDLLRAGLERAGFWEALVERAGSRGCAAGDLRIAVKPDLDIFEPGSLTGTAPALVEGLIALLRERGYPNVVLCDGRNRPDGWLHNRAALCVPELVGYRFEAPAGQPYDAAAVDDDHEPLPAAGKGENSLRISGAWLHADFRITFGKCKSDESQAYALCAHNLLGLLPACGSATRWKPGERCVHLIRAAAPDFALLDAVTSSHGSCGSRVACPLPTNTLIASPSALLVDWVAALKMGLDPYVSPVSSAALKAFGLPDAWRLDGELRPWAGWKSPSSLLLRAVSRREGWEEMDALAVAVLQPVDRVSFPFRDLVLDQLNAAATSRLERIDDPRIRDAVLLLVNQILAVAASARQAYVNTLDKRGVARSQAPVMSDPALLENGVFDAAVHAVRGFEQVLNGTPPDARGFRFRTIDGHIHFAASRVLPFPFDTFVERVEIARSIEFMNDYVGGARVVLTTDERARPVRQVERNVYLPQPNWVSVFGGEPIDVEKVERVERAADQHEIWWRTLRSENRSAESDDGSVSFVRTASGEVEVRIFARQKFRQPPAIAAAGVERYRTVYAELVSDAYSRFFDGTLANLTAVYEGREFRIGRDVRPEGEPMRGIPVMLAGAVALLERLRGSGSDGRLRAEARGSSGSGSALPLEIDEHGFWHYAGEGFPRTVTALSGAVSGGAYVADAIPISTFLTELGEAMARDLAAAVPTSFAAGES